MNFRGQKLGQTEQQDHRDFRMIRKVMGIFYNPRDLLGKKLGQTDHKGHQDLWGDKVGHSALSWHYDLLGVIN